MNFTEAFAKCISHNRHFQIDFYIGSGIMILTLAFKIFFVCLFQIDNVYSILLRPFELFCCLRKFSLGPCVSRMTISTRMTSVFCWIIKWFHIICNICKIICTKAFPKSFSRRHFQNNVHDGHLHDNFHRGTYKMFSHRRLQRWFHIGI